MMSAFGMFNALVMSYSRLPLAMARDGMMPRLFGKVTRKNHTPWVAIIVLATCWALCLGLGFKRLVTLDLMLYGAALMLEFVTLVALRIREPKLRREFRVPGGMAGAVTCGMFPLALLILAVVESGSETILGINGLAFGAIIIVAGILLYLATRKVLMPHSSQEALDTAEAA
jgi:amino acid transporter